LKTEILSNIRHNFEYQTTYQKQTFFTHKNDFNTFLQMTTTTTNIKHTHEWEVIENDTDKSIYCYNSAYLHMRHKADTCADYPNCQKNEIYKILQTISKVSLLR
jgi:hypothetical protein